MDAWARKSNAEREELFREAANSKAVHFQIIEKDFWVCWTLKRLFNISAFGQHLIFKGGTSLSKGYNLIERFSEDIDVAIDRSFLNFGDEEELKSLSSNKRQKWIENLDEACKNFVQTDVMSSLQTSIQQEVTGSFNEWRLFVAADDPYGQTYCSSIPEIPTPL